MMKNNLSNPYTSLYLKRVMHIIPTNLNLQKAYCV